MKLALVLHAVLASSVPICEFFVDSNIGSDLDGDGSFRKPFASPHRALTAVVSKSTNCPRPMIKLRSGVYELPSPLEIAGEKLNGLTFTTYSADLEAGLPPAELSGGRRLPIQEPDRDGVWRADLAALGVRQADMADRIFSLYVDSERRPRVRSQLLHWNHSISAHDPCHSCDINRYGFVFGENTFDKSWNLSPNSTSSWLLVSFHQVLYVMCTRLRMNCELSYPRGSRYIRTKSHL